MPTRVFNQILEIAENQGNYQKISLIFWSLFYFTCGSTAYLNPFLYFQESYVCPSSITKCTQYVCTLPPEERIGFIKSSIPTFADKFGDFRCEGRDQLSKIQSFIYLGGVFGVFFGSLLTNHFSNKKMLLITVTFNILGTVISLICNNLFIASIGFFLNFASKRIQVQVVSCYITQTVSQKIRGRYMMICLFFYALGVTFNGLVFYLIKQWHLVLIVYQMVPFLAIFLGLVLFIEETPFDLITRYSIDDSFKAFSRIAEINNKQKWSEDKLEILRRVKLEYQENQKEKDHTTISITDLFRFQSLRILAVVTICLKFLISYEFNVPQIILKDYAINIYLSGIIIGSSQIIASILCYFYVDHFERKKAILIAQSVAMLISILVFIFASCSSHQVSKCGSLKSYLQVISLFLFRFFITLSYNFFELAKYEMLPTQVRSMNSQLASAISGFALIFIPFMQSFFQQIQISMVSTFILSCFLTILIALKMPQTYKIPPPQMIKQLQYQSSINKACDSTH